MSNKSTILVVDDTPTNISILLNYLSRQNFRVLVARDGESAIEQAKFAKPDLILLDVMMPGLDGFETCKRLKDDEDTKEIPILFITALANTADKVKGFHIGAVDYVTKPIQHEEVLARVTTQLKIRNLQRELLEANNRLEERVMQQTSELLEANKQLKDALFEVERLKNQLQAENAYLKEEINRGHNSEEIVCESEELTKTLVEIKRFASTDATVLILGETGTGKELIARAIHRSSLRKERALVKVNCAALPSNLIEDELFGHEKGAFTGAFTQRIGRFELANGGTIFLDEIGDLPLELQAKLLRILQDGDFERLGNSETIDVDVRVIAATNKDLKSAIRSGEFREDLYYRLNVIPISLPPLRERKDDIPLLVTHFLEKNCEKFRKNIDTIPEATMEILQSYSWPGNVRELENIVERAVILYDGKSLQFDGLIDPRDDRSEDVTFFAQSMGGNDTFPCTLEEIERRHIIRSLDRCNWAIEGKRGAAAILALNPSTLRSRMKKLGIKKPNMA